MTTPRFMGREPVLWLTALNALVALAVGFGLDVDGKQQALIHATASAVFALAARSAVTPVNDDPADDGAAAAEMLLVLVIGFILGALCYANGILVGQ